MVIHYSVRNVWLWVSAGFCTAVYQCVSPLAPPAGGALTSLTVHYYFWYALCHSQLVPWVIVHCDWWPQQQHTDQPPNLHHICLKNHLKTTISNHLNIQQLIQQWHVVSLETIAQAAVSLIELLVKSIILLHRLYYVSLTDLDNSFLTVLFYTFVIFYLYVLF